jgi:hypothetical protein
MHQARVNGDFLVHEMTLLRPGLLERDDIGSELSG